MNIFYLDSDPTKCAQAHYDKHVVKMILETAQILSSSYHIYNNNPSHKVYKLTHKSHPSVKWCNESVNNWNWLRQLGLALDKEYTHRYGRKHKSAIVIENMVTPTNMPNADFTPPPMVMDNMYITDDTILSYRWMYVKQKGNLRSYTNRCEPDWMCGYEK